MIAGGGGSGGVGGTEVGEAGGVAAEPGSNGGPALQGTSAQPRKRSSWVSVANVPGRRRSIEPVSAYTTRRSSRSIGVPHTIVYVLNSATYVARFSA